MVLGSKKKGLTSEPDGFLFIWIIYFPLLICNILERVTLEDKGKKDTGESI